MARLKVNQNDVLDALCGVYPQIQRRGWKQSTIAAFVTDDDEMTTDDLGEYLRSVRLIPDGFVIHKEKRELEFFEVEVSHPLPAWKLEEYGAMWCTLDFYSIHFHLFVVNRYGHINEIELFDHYMAWSRSQLSANGSSS